MSNKLSRNEVESLIMSHLFSIKYLSEKYNPNADYLNCCIQRGSITINNEYWGPDCAYPIKRAVLIESEEE